MTVDAQSVAEGRLSFGHSPLGEKRPTSECLGRERVCWLFLPFWITMAASTQGDLEAVEANLNGIVREVSELGSHPPVSGICPSGMRSRSLTLFSRWK